MTILEKFKTWVRQAPIHTERPNHVVNYMDYHIPTPPPIEVENPMKPSFINTPPPIERKPSSTSLPKDYFIHWCGSTETYETNLTTVNLVENDPTKLDETPLKRFLMKKYPWVLDVTELRIQYKGDRRNIETGAILCGPLEIHITVSPIHHTELMNPKIETKVREKLYENLLPLITCMYEHNNRHKPQIIFSPSHSETILEHLV